LKYETAAQKAKREKEEEDKTHFKITYTDCLIPDEVFDTPAYQTIVKTRFIKNLPQMVAEFYRRKR
jgi:hypothetical protein